MRYLTRTVLGAALLGFGLVAETYGISSLIQTGSCGPDSGGPVECPSGTGPMVVMVVLSTFGAIVGCGILGSRGEPDGGGRPPSFWMGIGMGQLLYWAAAIPAGVIAVVLALIDLDEGDTRPGLEVVAAALVPLLLIGLVMRKPARRPAPAQHGGGVRVPPPMSASPAHVAHSMGFAPPPPSTTDVHHRLAVLDSQVRDGHLSPAQYEAERRRILTGG